MNEGQIKHNFLIRSVDRNNDLALHTPYDRWKVVFRPSSFSSTKLNAGWGNLRLQILDAEVSFSDEFAGVQVCFESGTVSASQIRQIADEMCESAARHSQIPCEVVML